jgi:hypothetical protein
MSETSVRDHEGGGGPPDKTELKRERRIGVRGSAKV